MTLKLSDWNNLSTSQKNNVIKFLRNNCKIDAEIPASEPQQSNSYPITAGTTSGGYPMKFGKEFRIYLISAKNCPSFLQPHCMKGTRTYEARIGGNEAIEAIMQYGGLKFGDN
ncbi:hypothetical protein [Desulfovibrio sp. ZJ200]|uniref:hypothetical protein n=1 Tax=Desulfovibrio sp. ZJ200 TaxID=2709792 RepID=UPI0013EB4188|nr:hypothetical protein [Desulfovibrio sp. ZJ200]